MATQRTSGTLIANIESDLADNNAGLISAADVRNNIADTVASINVIVASGNTNTQFPFRFDVRAQVQDPSGTPYGGTFIAESGIMFPNAPANSGSRQVEPFLGVGNLTHNSLGGLTTGDPHTQYVSISGHRVMTGNLMVGANWIGPSGSNGDGIRFVKESTGTKILVSGALKFSDNSTIDTGKGVARAWANFDASGTSPVNHPFIRSSYGVSGITRLAPGKFKITFNSGVFKDNYYVAMGHSNSTTASGSKEDFDINTVGLVMREGDDGSTLRTITFVVKNDAGEYVDGEMNDFVAFGNAPTVTASYASGILSGSYTDP